MNRDKTDSRTVFRIVAVAIATAAAAALLALVVIKIDTTIRWFVTAVFLALVLAPAVELIQRIRIRGRKPPRWAAISVTFVAAFVALGFLVLNVIPPMVDEVEQVGSLGPQYVHDAQQWANDSEEFRGLNQQYHLTDTLKSQAAELPSHFSSAAGELESFTVSLLKHLVSAITVLVLAFFLLLEGPGLLNRLLAWIGGANTPFSRLYTLVTRQRRVRHRSADPLRRAGLKPRPFVPRITCNGAAQVLHWNRDQQYSQYAAHAGPSFDGADCDAKACGQSCDPNIDNAERPIALLLNQLADELCINLLETDLKVVFPFGFRERIQVYPQRVVLTAGLILS